MPDTFFTSDHHFGHANIIKIANRPFSCADEMRDALIDRWNSVVKPGDTVYHLGDFSLRMTWRKALRIVERLNGHLFLIRGNHDPFVWAPSVYVEKTFADRPFVLCHYPIEDWNGRHRGAVHLHGHTHSHEFRTAPNCFNLCVEATDYAPVALDTILAAAQ